MNDIKLYEDISEFENKFPIKIRKYSGSEFYAHWHEHIELNHILNGNGVFYCNSNSISLKKGETIVINPNELHYMS